MTQRTLLGLTHNPFAPPREGFFQGGDRKTHLDHLRHLSQWSRRVLVVTGPFGIGKSSLFRELSSSLEGKTKAARLAGTVLTTEREVMVGLLQGFGQPAENKRHVEDLVDQVLAHVAEQETQGRVCMAMVDDAHLLDLRAVQRLVQLVAISGLRLLLFSEPGLVSEVDRAARLHELEWFEIRLTGLPKADVRDYLEWRFRQAHYRGLLPFTEEQLENIVLRSAGNLGVIDSMANRLLADIESGEIRKPKGRFPLMHAALTASLVVLVTLVYLLIQQSALPPQERALETVAGEPAAKEAVSPPTSAPAEPLEASEAAPRTDTPKADEPSSVSEQVSAADNPALPAQATTQERAAEKELTAAQEQPIAQEKAQSGEQLVAPSQAEHTPQAQRSDSDAEPPLPAPVAQPLQSQAEPSDDAPSANAAAAGDPVPASPVPQARYNSAEWLLRQNPERFTLQLMTLSSRARAEDFISRQDNQEEFAVYSMMRDGVRMYVVTYGVFSGRSAAERTATGFSGELARLNPWVRPMAGVQQTVRDNPQD